MLYNRYCKPSLFTTMQTTEIVSLKLPDFWASALINGDYSSFSYPEDYKEITDFIDHYKKELDFNTVFLRSDENGNIDSHFMTFHDARDFGVLACDVIEYHFFKIEK